MANGEVNPRRNRRGLHLAICATGIAFGED